MSIPKNHIRLLTLIPLIAILAMMPLVAILPVNQASAISPPFLDAKASSSCNGCTSTTATLTTTGPDLILVFAAYGNCPTPKAPVDTAGSTFTFRFDHKACGNLEITEYYTVTTSALTSDTVTCSSTSNSWIDCVVEAWGGSSGFDISSPYVSTGGCGTPCVSGVTTTTANDAIVDFGTDTGQTVQTAGSGYTLITALTFGQDGYSQYKIAAVPVSGETEAFGVSMSNSFMVMADALAPSGTTTTTSTTTTSSTTTTTTTTASTGFYLGAKSASTLVLPNTGARASIEVQSFAVPPGGTYPCVWFWIADATSNNLWIQTGYNICYYNGPYPNVFMQVWNLTSGAAVKWVSIGNAVPTGVHQFSVALSSGTTWTATVDGITIGSYDMGSSVSSSTYPVYSMTEENGVTTPFSIPLEFFPVAIQAYVSGAWRNAPTSSVSDIGATWGLQGQIQNAAIPANSMVFGGPESTPGDGVGLW